MKSVKRRVKKTKLEIWEDSVNNELRLNKKVVLVGKTGKDVTFTIENSDKEGILRLKSVCKVTGGLLYSDELVAADSNLAIKVKDYLSSIDNAYTITTKQRKDLEIN